MNRELDFRGELEEEITIREYQEETDRQALVERLEGLYDYTSVLDEYGRMVRQPGYGDFFTQELLDDVAKSSGIIYVATDEKQVVGFAACVILKQSEKDRLRSVPLIDGRVSKLFVDSEYRNRDIGAKLMGRAEDFFKKAKCDLVRVEVFVPNTGAHRLYERLGYRDRVVDMVKKL